MRMLFLVATAMLSAAPALARPMTMQARETAVWQSVKDQQIDTFAAYLAPNYVAVYDDGIHDKATEVEFVRGQTLRGFRMGNFTSRTIDGGEDVLLTYRIDVRGNKGKTNFSGRYWATSLWHRSGKSWSLVYHSDVKAK